LRSELCRTLRARIRTLDAAREEIRADNTAPTGNLDFKDLLQLLEQNREQSYASAVKKTYNFYFDKNICIQ
jgi:two-component sensor histidine kinase